MRGELRQVLGLDGVFASAAVDCTVESRHERHLVVLGRVGPREEGDGVLLSARRRERAKGDGEELPSLVDRGGRRIVVELLDELSVTLGPERLVGERGRDGLARELLGIRLTSPIQARMHLNICVGFFS